MSSDERSVDVSYPDFKKRVLDRDNRQCRYCGRGEDEVVQLTPHHIVYRAEGGSNKTSNGIALCKTHHYAVHRFGDSGDDPLEVLREWDIPKEIPTHPGSNDYKTQLILRAFLKGKDEGGPWGILTSNIAREETGLDDKGIQAAFSKLDAAGFVMKPHRGVYEITSRGVKAYEQQNVEC